MKNKKNTSSIIRLKNGEKNSIWSLVSQEFKLTSIIYRPKRRL